MPKIRGIKDDVVDRLCKSVAYDGPFPDSSAGYYALTPGLSKRDAFVYLLLDEHDGLMYVGKANCPGNRFDKHRRQKDWWPEVAQVILLHIEGADAYETHCKVHALEGHLIRTLRPLFNIAGVSRVLV